MSNDPTSRALQLLSLLQTHKMWRGAELAERLEVTERTVRRDVDRLRDLGYPVDATSGTDGGYRLAVGAHMPPLVLTDDEAVAVAVGLRTAAGAAISGIEDTSLHALAKIEQLLPDRLRRRVSALNSSVTALRRSSNDDEVVDSNALGILAAACRDHEEVRFDYRRRDGEDSRRLVEPHQMVTVGRRWYLVAWDLRRTDWRTFRMDRLNDAALAGSRFVPREIPGGDAAAYVATSLGSRPREIEALVEVGAPYAEIEAALQWTDHTPVEVEPTTCVVRIRADQLDWLILAIARLALTARATVLEPPSVAIAVGQLVDRLANPPLRDAIELRGRRVLLRTTRREDREALVAIRLTKEVRRRWRGDDLEAEFDADFDDNEVHRFTIVDPSGRTAGLIQYGEEDDPEYRHASVDIYVDPNTHRQGFATDAIRTLVGYLFDVRGHHRLTIDPTVENEGAIACYSNIGFAPVGVMREYELRDDGSWADGMLMELLASDWIGQSA